MSPRERRAGKCSPALRARDSADTGLAKLRHRTCAISIMEPVVQSQTRRMPCERGGAWHWRPPQWDTAGRLSGDAGPRRPRSEVGEYRSARARPDPVIGCQPGAARRPLPHHPTQGLEVGTPPPPNPPSRHQRAGRVSALKLLIRPAGHSPWPSRARLRLARAARGQARDDARVDDSERLR